VRAKKNKAIFSGLFNSLIIFAVVTSLIFALTNCNDSTSESHAEQVSDIELNSFGFYSDSLEHQKYSVEKNETLSDILINLGIGGNELVEIVNNTKEINNDEILEFDGFWVSSFTESAAKGYPDIEVIGVESRYETIRQILNNTNKPPSLSLVKS